MLKPTILAAVLLAPLPALAQTAQEQATIYVNGLQSFVGTKVIGKTKISKIHAEGDTVVFTVDGQLWPSNPEKATTSFVEGLCQGAPNFFTNGVMLRLNFTERKKETLYGPTLDSCPKPKS
jgi:hypothetical protein